MLAALLPILGNIFQGVAASLFPNPEDKLKAQELQTQLQLAVIAQSGALEQAAADNVKGEIGTGNWLTKSWRPLMMLWFAILIGARWFGYSAPGLSPDEYLELWSIIKIGIGGYTIGRSAEKIAPAVTSVFKK